MLEDHMHVAGRGTGAAAWSLPEAHLHALSGQGVVKAFPRNAVMISEGDRTDSLYIILSGSVKVYLSDEAGKEIQLRILGPGEYFGEVILDEGARSASVMTLEPCRFSIISLAQFKAFLTQSPDAAFELIKSFAAHIRDLTRQVGDLALLDVYGRVARLLLELAVEEDGRLVVPRLTQQDIAARVGCTREMVSRILKDLRTGGYIVMEGERMVIARKPPRGW
jgi:CRP/FNR family cyclic AMP-dependent transcriptional regulator